MHHVRPFIMGTLPKSLHKPLVTFMGAFCLLGKNHKSTPIHKRWPRHPVVGLHQGATKFSSMLLSTFVTILLRLERTMDALNAPHATGGTIGAHRKSEHPAIYPLGGGVEQFVCPNKVEQDQTDRHVL